jgi:hypothetical protein
MQARTKIRFPTGVVLAEGMEVYVPQQGDDRVLAKGNADITIIQAERVGDSEIEVTLSLSASLVATLMPKNGHGNPAIRVSVGEPPVQ